MLKIVAPKVPKRLPEFIRESEINKLFDNIEMGVVFFTARNYLTLLILYETGMRKAELISIKDEDIDTFKNQISVIGKGDKQRIIPISIALLDNIQKYQSLRDIQFTTKPGQFLLLTDKGKKMYPKLVYNIIHAQLSLIATNSKKSPHILRHSFATHMANYGAELNSIKELLGHSSLAATQIYTHNSIQKLKEVYQRSHPKAT